MPVPSFPTSLKVLSRTCEASAVLTATTKRKKRTLTKPDRVVEKEGLKERNGLGRRRSGVLH
jgi:hypothetical protein